MQQQFADYLSYVGFNGQTYVLDCACELCGNIHFNTLAHRVKVDENKFCKLPIGCCSQCGYIMQTPRFEREFYTWYFKNHYSHRLFGNTEPEREFVVDQHRRGLAIFNALSERLPKTGKLLDVGCSSGGLMIPFVKNGWQVMGTDPDAFYAEYGARKLGLDIKTAAAEDMDLPKAYFDLVVIASALEHVYDLNKVLQNIRAATSNNGLLFIETRGLDYAIYSGSFSHHYRRYLTENSLKSALGKNNYEVLWTTQECILGPSRPGSTFTLARAVSLRNARQWTDQLSLIKEKIKELEGVDE